LLSVSREEVTMKGVTAVALVALSGCATVAEGNLAKPIDLGGHFLATPATTSGLVVHGRELTFLSSPDFGVLEFTFENPTDHWVRIDRVHVDFGSPAANQGVTAIDGDDIAAWQIATEQRNAVRAANNQTALDVLALGASIGAARRHHGPARAAAVGVAVGAMMAASATAASGQDLYPDDHLYAVPIAIPPGLFAKRWIVFNSDASANRTCLGRATLDYDTSGPARERVVLDFRSSANGSEWQAAACRAMYPTLSVRTRYPG
jgi:hypothetical protein